MQRHTRYLTNVTIFMTRTGEWFKNHEGEVIFNFDLSSDFKETAKIRRKFSKPPH